MVPKNCLWVNFSKSLRSERFKLENLKGIDAFWTHNDLGKLNHEDIKSLNRPIRAKKSNQ